MPGGPSRVRRDIEADRQHDRHHETGRGPQRAHIFMGSNRTGSCTGRRPPTVARGRDAASTFVDVDCDQQGRLGPFTSLSTWASRELRTWCRTGAWNLGFRCCVPSCRDTEPQRKLPHQRMWLQAGPFLKCRGPRQTALMAGDKPCSAVTSPFSGTAPKHARFAMSMI